MGYPRYLQVLIVEDETPMLETYRGYLDKLSKTRPIAIPCTVQSYLDAIEQLKSDNVFHIVILDLRLPEHTASEPDEGSARGLELVQRIAEREHRPVPVMAIITGDPGRITRFAPLQKQLEDGFWHAEILKKSIDLIQDLEKLVDKALDYIDVGVIVGDVVDERRPSLTLRDEDLLRRAVLEQGAIGVDLMWWAAQRKDGGESPDRALWSKILQGRFMDRSDGFSRPHFFKLESCDDSSRAHAAARRMESKLQHVNVVGHWASASTSLLVTGKAGPSPESPVPIGDFLRWPAVSVAPLLPRIASDIATQLRSFPKSALQHVPLSTLIWLPRGIDRRNSLTDVARRWGIEKPRPDPVAVFEEICSASRMTWVERRVGHGDLHTGNVSLDRDGDSVRAFIIDAGALDNGVCSSDLAALEISLMLHESDPTGESVLELQTAIELFDGTAPNGTVSIGVEVPNTLRNTIEFVSALRREALSECTPEVYAVLLMDQVLIQLGGLAFGTSNNRIRRPLDSVRLFEHLAGWLGGIGITSRSS